MVEIRLLGGFGVRIDGETVDIPSRAAQSLLAYLALSPNVSHRREKLAGVLWPDSDERNARKYLSQALWRLRKTLGPDYFQADKVSVSLIKNSELELDVSDLEDSSEDSLEALIQSLSVYKGKLLPGFYQDWAVLEGERLESVFERKMQALLDRLIEAGRCEKVLEWGERWLAQGRTPESAYRALMMAYSGLGDQVKVAEVYRRCLEALEQVLGVEPSEETQNLYLRLSRRELPRQVRAGQAKKEPLAKLPLQPTPFVGRQNELAQIGGLLGDPDVRLVTILGPGGIGKTRVAIEVAKAQAGQFPDGVFFVPLAPIEVPDLITEPVAKSLQDSIYRDDLGFMATPIARAIDMPLYRKDFSEGWTGDWQEGQVLSYLQEKEMLLVLDNFEHLLDGVGLLANILGEASGVKILATSRESLRLHGETIFTLEGMRVTEGMSSDENRNSEAVKLFLQSARRAQPQFSPTSDDLNQIVRIGRLVDGMPLALELAAAWVGVLSVKEIGNELEQGIDLLATDLVDFPERHQSIRSAFDLTWNRLGDTERDVFKQLSVFRGGFTRQAAQKVAEASLPTLMSLVNKSLLRRDLNGRFQIHELLRQYGAFQLRQSHSDFFAAKDRHSAYIAALISEMGPVLKSGDQRKALEYIEKEHENARSAWNWAVGHQKLDEIEQSMESLFEFYRIRAMLQEAWDALYMASKKLGWGGFRKAAKNAERKQSHAELIREDQTSGLDPKYELMLGKLLAWYGRFHCENPQADPKNIQVREEALQILRKYDARLEIATLLVFTGHTGRSLADAEACYLEALGTFKVAGDRWGEAWATGSLGWIGLVRGNYRLAKRYSQESLAIFEELGNQDGIVRALLYLGFTDWIGGAYKEAEGRLQKALTFSEEIANQAKTAAAIRYLGLVAMGLGDYQTALARFLESLEVYREIGLNGWQGVNFADRSYVCIEMGKYSEALALAQEGLSICRQINYAEGITWAATACGFAALGLGKRTDANGHFCSALNKNPDLRAVPYSHMLHALVGMASLWAAAGESIQAYSLAWFVIQNTASWQWTKDKTSPLLADLETRLTSEEVITSRLLYAEKSVESVAEMILENTPQ